MADRCPGWVAALVALGLAAGCAPPGPGSGAPDGGTAAPLRFVAIAAGDHFTCAVDRTGHAWCWGYDADRTLGSGGADAICYDDQGNASFCAEPPVEVPGLSGLTAIVAGESHVCALDGAGAAWCWGVDDRGEAGDGAVADAMGLPVEVAGGHRFTAIGVGLAHSCALDEAGAAWCWGEILGDQGGGGFLAPSQVPRAVPGGLTFTALAVGGHFACGLEGDGTAACWGSGQLGERGPASGTGGPAPTAIPSSVTFTTLGAGDDHACAVDGSANAWCWGGNRFGQLGNGSFTDSQVPRQVTFDTSFAEFVAVAGGFDDTCGLGRSGRVLCWGRNDYEQLGRGPHPFIPNEAGQPVPGTYTAVAVGATHVCALDTNGHAHCWGEQAQGEVGAGTKTPNAETPVAVQGPG